MVISGQRSQLAMSAAAWEDGHMLQSWLIRYKGIAGGGKWDFSGCEAALYVNVKRANSQRSDRASNSRGRTWIKRSFFRNGECLRAVSCAGRGIAQGTKNKVRIDNDSLTSLDPAWYLFEPCKHPEVVFHERVGGRNANIHSWVVAQELQYVVIFETLQPPATRRVLTTITDSESSLLWSHRIALNYCHSSARECSRRLWAQSINFVV